jgi:hypothetical protein
MKSLMEIYRTALRALWPQRGGQAGYRRFQRCGFEPLEPRLALAGDIAWTPPPKVEIDIRLFQPSGAEVTSLAAGDEFVMKVFVTDARREPQGVFGTYLDVTWDPAIAVATGPLKHAAPYLNGKEGRITSGLIDEAGGFAGSSPLSVGAFELFSVPMRATGNGSLLFEANPAENFGLEVLVYGLNDQGDIPDEEVDYGTALVVVGDQNPSATFVAAADSFQVLEDSTEVSLAPLANDAKLRDQFQVLSISAVSELNRGGSMRVAADGKTLVYSPAANFYGVETFTYTARNQQGEEHTAAVRVEVREVNDVPMAVNDTFKVKADSGSNFLPVLQNDIQAPDRYDVLQIASEGAGNRGGMIWRSGPHIIYLPAQGFVGTETFTYTIRDREIGGLTSTATVTVEVVGAVEAVQVEAADDTVTVQDHTVETVIDVLANDTAANSSKEDVRIVSVIPPTEDVPISIAPDGKSLIYSGSSVPRSFTNVSYVVSDAAGVLSSATLTLNFASMNLVSPEITLADGVLQITGSPADDRLVVNVSRRRLRVTGTLAGEAVNESFAPRAVRKIVAELGEGNDSLTVKANVSAALRVNAGAGNDAVFAGLGAAVVVGGNGDDTLRGGAKRDVLIGGLGSDRIIPRGANDFVIQEATAYDGDVAALDVICAEWGSRRSVAARRANIQYGAGRVLGPLEVSLDLGLLEQEPGTIFYPLASKGR